MPSARPTSPALSATKCSAKTPGHTGRGLPGKLVQILTEEGGLWKANPLNYSQLSGCKTSPSGNVFNQH